MRALRALSVVLLLLPLALAGCIDAGDAPLDQGDGPADAPDYEVPPQDFELAIVEDAFRVPGGSDDVEIHVRVARPDTDEPVPVIVEFTPYRLLGQRQTLVEPMVNEPGGRFVDEFVRRGFAFAWADVRGTGDSSGCLDLRGSNDIADAWALTDHLGTVDWSNGKVGFIGASYPGSTSHIGAIANNPHVGGVIPVVASTSFYHYQHKGGVPYSNSIGTTNAGYTGFAVGPTVNAHDPAWGPTTASKAACPHHDHVFTYGASDLDGEYHEWWQDRNLRPRVGEVEVPVLMAQGLQDWNVKPDHIAEYFNDLNVRKVLVAPQMGHAYPPEAEDAYGNWWQYAVAFFDETLRGTHTGLFDEDYAWVEDSEGTWRRYDAAWPPLDAAWTPVNLTADGLSRTDAPAGTVAWDAVPYRDMTFTERGENEQVVLGGLTLDETLHTSGTPYLDLTVTTSAEVTHLVAVLEARLPGSDDFQRVNYGYLDPIYRNGVENPEPVTPGEPTPVTIDFYPQEDVFPAGTELRLILRSGDDGRTVPVFDEGRVEVTLDGERPGQLWLPLSPLTH